MAPLIQGFFREAGEPGAFGTGFRAELARFDGEGWAIASAAAVSVEQASGISCAAWGSPRFHAPALARLARERGIAAAWLRAYEEAGEAAPAMAGGRFAFVLIDSARRRLLAGVDRFGTFPLCFAREDGGLAFSDRADSVPGPERPLVTQALFDYLFFHHIPAPETVFAGIRRLPAAHMLRLDGGELACTPYWEPAFLEPRSADLAACSEEFIGLIRDSVGREADNDGVGAFLSGGTDSSTVSGMLCRALGGPARTYSIGFDANGYDEMGYARVAARHFGARHHEYYVTPEDLLEGIPAVAAHFDQPFGNSSALPAWICARRARADGVHKLLAGDGGDELFGGNARYATQRVFAWYENLPAPLRRRLIEPVAATPGLRRLPIVRKGVSYVEQARVPLPDRTERYNLLLRLGLQQVFEPGFLAAIDAERPARMQRETWQGIRAHALINRMLAFDWKYTLADNDLPKVVGATGLAGVDVAFPLLSDELVDFSLRLPPEWKLRGLTLRWFFKEALRQFLPPEIIAKKKHGFGLPFGVWAATHPRLRQMSLRALESFGARGIIREDFLHHLVTDLVPAKPGYYGEMVWIVMALEHWLAAHRPAFTVRR